MERRRFGSDQARAVRAGRFAAELAGALYELGLTHKDVAQALGVPRYTVDSWTRGDDSKIPGGANLAQLCALLEARKPGLGSALASAAGHAWPGVGGQGLGVGDSLQTPTPNPQPPAPAEAHPTNLPTPLTPLVGREREVAAVRNLILGGEVRLLTLTGPGGIGKTRLGLRAASGMVEQFEDGVFFVNLAPITDPNLVIPTIAQTLNVREARGHPLVETLGQHLRDRQMLLLLDNFEQVAEAAPGLNDLLAAPHLKMLVTSRVGLHIYGEHDYQVPPLSVPSPKSLVSSHESGDIGLETRDLRLETIGQYDAVRLFIERARAAKSDFAMTNDNAPAVAEICYRLDGLPLAIELAAARIRMLSPDAMLRRLDSRLTLLTGGSRDLPARQQTLRGTIEWSYDLLDRSEQQLFRRLAVFVGGCTLEAAELVTKNFEFSILNSELAVDVKSIQNSNFKIQNSIDVLDGMELLVSKSLVQQRAGLGEPGFCMLETIHEFARERLRESGEEAGLRRRHALYFMDLAEEAEPHLAGVKQAQWLNLLEDEHDNIRAALACCLENGEGEDVLTGLRLAGAIARYWEVRGYMTEGRERLAEVLAAWATTPAMPEGSSDDRQGQVAAAVKAARAKALNGAGSLASRQGDYAAARSYYEESLAIRRELGDVTGIANSLNNLGVMEHMRGDHTSARTLFEESLGIGRESGDKRNVANSLNNLGMVAREQGDHERERALLEESLAIWTELGDTRGIAMSLNNLGIAALERRDYASARALHEQSLAIKRELGDKQGIASSIANLGIIASEQGDLASASTLYEESLTLARELGNRRVMAACLAGLAGLAAQRAQGERGELEQPAQLERAARLSGAVEALLEATGAVLDSEDRRPYERNMALVRDMLGDEVFSRYVAEGRALPLERAIAYALEESHTGPV